ncbi:chemotaxis-specific protein-glutamate methyltransferase CheB [Sphingomonas pseudosanguinis]|uniref:protein-glutamate methylesterase n=1 Tax=Sphingomonas pseudosanguinis TaxID=413712 RepID=A0A7W6AAX6_9SPHN|nr:chemotaxis-specific protein-glutamate methyltransferase CheB [Sphingomonas pseudosanguinis]MBB3879967.1 two-component system chemotaxis response regulator CheB [Sphingomonas pseudosanguinis]MBN3537438.1 chemotaxis-specific protein-glutamate methyltransferase CheB [Sphingomonas pseudosanguinis]
MASFPYPRPAMPDAGTRILIVDDSAVARALIARQIEPLARFAVVGAVTHVDAALAFLAEHDVDIILLDVAMPGIDGITALPRLLAAGRGARIIIVSSSTPDGGAATVQALAHGAADTLVKPQPKGLSEFGEALRQKLDALAVPNGVTTLARAPVAPLPATRGALPDIIGIGASTGGIHALAKLLAPLPATMTVPIVVTQHLPASFMSYFAAQLAAVARRPCDVAQDRQRLRPGRIVVAPGDAHMTFAALPDGGAAIRLQYGRARSGCLPSVDPMFAAMARVWGRRALGIVLTGMGRDGLEGAETLKAAGGTIIAQDEASSVVWGMPGVVVGHDLADMVLPPEAIGAMLAQAVQR